MICSNTLTVLFKQPSDHFTLSYTLITYDTIIATGHTISLIFACDFS